MIPSMVAARVRCQPVSCRARMMSSRSAASREKFIGPAGGANLVGAAGPAAWGAVGAAEVPNAGWKGWGENAEGGWPCGWVWPEGEAGG